MPHLARHARAALALTVLSLASTTQAQSTVVVDQVALTFVPQDITITCGDTVQWVWSFGFHTVTEGATPVADPAFDYTFILNDVFHTFDTKFLFEFPRAGHVYDYICVPHFSLDMIGSVTVDCPWSHAGDGKAGALGVPLLYGTGDLTPSSAGTIELENAAPSSSALLFVGLSEGAAPFKGGTLVPVPVLLQVGLATDSAGETTLPFVVPLGATGIDVYLQVAVADPAASQSISLSNAGLMALP